MFRNTYLELYKTSAASEQGLPHLIAHFTQIYNTLGCVLQDLEFQVGKLLAAPSNHPPPQLQVQPAHSPPNPPPKRDNQKKEVKIEELSLAKAPELPPVQLKTVDQSKQKSKKDEQSYRKDWNPQLAAKPQSAKQVPRGPVGSDSFDSLFDARRPQVHSPMQVERRPGITQVRQQSNTYEDFMQRLFREQQDRRSR